MQTKFVNEIYLRKDVLGKLEKIEKVEKIEKPIGDIKDIKELKTLEGHTNWVRCVAFSPDGKYFASGSDDYTIKIWNFETGEHIKTLKGHNSWVNSVVFSPNGKYLVSGSRDNTIKIWDFKTGNLFKTIGGNNKINSIVFSPNGKYIVSGSSDKTIKIWNFKTGENIKSLNGHTDIVKSIAFSPNRKYFASGSSDKTIKIWNFKTGENINTLYGHTDSVESVVFSPDGKYLVSGSDDKTIKIWNFETGQSIKTLKGHTAYVFSVAFSPNGKYIASASWDNTIKIWNFETGQNIKTLNGHTGYVNSVTFSPNGKYIVSGGADKTIKIWSIISEINNNKKEDNKKENVNITDFFLNEDKIRVDLTPYNQKMLEDVEQGDWSLWQNEKEFENNEEYEKVTLPKPLVARNPKSSIINGVVGIDFGTKSTIVVCQKGTTQIQPMRIGTGNLSEKIESSHYENPTIMEFNNLENFIKKYKNREGRPFTKWEDLTISHTAYENFKNSKSEYFNSFLSELKQWAGTKDKRLKIVDKNGFLIDLPPFLEIEDDEINPIEIYAYYLGLYINNQFNGIFLDYILSFPVTYEIEIREKILKSFEKGLLKSLPQELHNQEEEIKKLSVIQGASEPAAYAVIALEEYGFEPEGNEKVFYGVFDFGGGTTDFDFGIFREANGKKERRYDFVIEHFGAGGDRFLGGENLLELLAFEVFKDNKETLLKEKIQFTKPPETKDFLGSEQLLSNSREAKMNTKNLMEVLRPFWENSEEKFEEDTLKVNLWDVDAKQKAGADLTFNKERITEILRNRIEKGIKNFFESLRLAFVNHQNLVSDVEEINIFLAGNSSKSPILRELFDEELKEQNEFFKKELQKENDIFKIYAPLDNKDNFEKPNGKTGVAFGLVETRKGGDILVIDHDVKEEVTQIPFKFYLGESRRKKFKVIIDRNENYNKWIEFIDAGDDVFEVYYSSQSIVTTNQVSINDESIKKISLKIDIIDEDANVYIRLVSPNEFEYVVATEEGIKNEEYLNEIKKISLK